eukprot:CAMPEP_0197725742 /NCGR_PEP_ID=MMETSP1434-20131217/10187_1 /TAXON_ID=265543 /ORGANISM="Minutocellus polymorphus, Strain CCMP3303" /LENGTH=49 /DNA_ID=CAMNT_0043311377 /DNA_START=448 /DNA_END=597 /DNA_ORIENTATION=+
MNSAEYESHPNKASIEEAELVFGEIGDDAWERAYAQDKVEAKADDSKKE